MRTVWAPVHTTLSRFSSYSFDLAKTILKEKNASTQNDGFGSTNIPAYLYYRRACQARATLPFLQLPVFPPPHPAKPLLPQVPQIRDK